MCKALNAKKRRIRELEAGDGGGGGSAAAAASGNGGGGGGGGAGGTVVGRGGGRTLDLERTALKLANSKRNGKEPAAAAAAADGDDSESFGGEAYTEDYLEEASDSDDALSDDYNTDEEKSLIRQESEERHERSDSRRNSFSSVGAANGDGVGGATLEGGVDVYNAETQDAEADSDAQAPASIDRASAQSTPELSEADSDSSLEALL